MSCPTCGSPFDGSHFGDCPDATVAPAPAPLPSNERVHDLKTWPEFFENLWVGRKTFELRKDDRGFGLGDTLLLREWSPVTRGYTGRSERRTISHILRGPVFGLQDGWVIISFAHETSGWQPIASCPKNGTAFLCGWWNATRDYFWITKAHWAAGVVDGGWDGAREPIELQAGFWMPLPAPAPQLETKSVTGEKDA